MVVQNNVDLVYVLFSNNELSDTTAFVSAEQRRCLQMPQYSKRCRERKVQSAVSSPFADLPVSVKFGGTE